MPILLDVLIALSFLKYTYQFKEKEHIFRGGSPERIVHSLSMEINLSNRVYTFWEENSLVHLKYRVCLVKRVCCLPLFSAYNNNCFKFAL